MRLMIAFISSLAVAYTLAVLAYTQLNLANLIEMGFNVSYQIRIESALHDLFGMTSVYLPILAVALLVAFGITEITSRWLNGLRVLLYVLAGILVPVAIDYVFTFSFWGLNIIEDTHPIAVTRTTAGLLSQSFACAVGGFVFALIFSNNLAKD